MNPRHRRLLIPGLLLALLVVVVVASLAREARAAEGEGEADAVVVSTVTDPRITESSGLAVSARFDDLAYTVNDSGSEPTVYALRVSSGEVVGETRVEGVRWADTEALALDGEGTLWVADTGDNAAARDDVALYSLPEPGPGDGTAEAQRHPVAYDGGATDVESLAVDPGDGSLLLVTKELLAGRVLRLAPPLSTDEPSVPEETTTSTLLLATDASFSPDGEAFVVRNYLTAAVHDAASGDLLRTEELPAQDQGETLAFEPSGRSYLVGSEGTGADLWRVGFDADDAGAPAPTATPTPDPAASYQPDGVGRPWLYQLGGLVAVAVLALVSWWGVKRPRKRRW